MFDFIVVTLEETSEISQRQLVEQETRELRVEAQPVTFTKKLQSLEADEGSTVTLRCETSEPLVSVEWKKEAQVLTSGDKYRIKQQASANELLITQVVPEDSGDYSCVCGTQTTTACVKIMAMKPPASLPAAKVETKIPEDKEKAEGINVHMAFSFTCPVQSGI
ncbi:obscurin-like [Hippocampus zosterae]|uniref:obscurin-like n=1 Tax=Hippocampus zosterae TaxID=109293 RepID=UPI00223D2F0C|nr:obscurin-like [Hippocampus zosterae]